MTTIHTVRHGETGRDTERQVDRQSARNERRYGSREVRDIETKRKI